MRTFCFLIIRSLTTKNPSKHWRFNSFARNLLKLEEHVRAPNFREVALLVCMNATLYNLLFDLVQAIEEIIKCLNLVIEISCVKWGKLSEPLNSVTNIKAKEDATWHGSGQNDVS